MSGVRRRGRLGLLAIFLLATLTPAATSGAAQGTEIRELTVNGVKRAYRLFIPSRVRTAPLAVIFALHGAAQTAQEFEADIGLNRVAEREGFAVVYPEGLNRVWDDDRPSVIRLEFAFKPGDDATFLRTLARTLVGEGIADPRRIYLTGLSMGGFMVARMVCEHADLFAAAAILAATVPKKYQTECRPRRTMPVLMMHGTADPISSWYGVVVPGAELLSASESAQFFADRAGCMAMSDVALPNSASVTVRRWSICRDNSSVVLYRIPGAGHLPPSFDKGRGETFVSMFLAERSHAIDAAEEIWSFFRRFQTGDSV